MSVVLQTIGFRKHDHASCVEVAVERAQEVCDAQGLNFTPVRRRVLEILLADHRALGAYDILDRLREEGLGSQPPVAYRALDFLVEHGFAHRVEKLNAFVACGHSDRAHSPAFLICRGCDAVAETEAETSRGPLGKTAKAAGFQIETSVVEIEGLCRDCQGNSP